jgi:hypothetical protein
MKASKNDETLANSIKQSTQHKGERKNKERGPKSEEQNPKGVRKVAKEQMLQKEKPDRFWYPVCILCVNTNRQEHHWSQQAGLNGGRTDARKPLLDIVGVSAATVDE